MNRPVIQLHTIQQWLAVPREVRSIILQHLRVKDRLQRYLEQRVSKPPLPDEGVWIPCKRCDKRGWIQKFPRHAGVHPSQLPHPCLLRTYWQMEGREERERHNPRDLITFDIGHAVHHMLQSYGLDGAWGPVYQPEVHMTEGSHPLATSLMIEGHADAENILVIDDIPNAPIYEVGCVHEYKTIKTENFKKLTRPKPEHKQQAIIYSAVLNRPVVVYLYVCKNDSGMSDYPVAFEPEMWASAEQKARLLIAHYESEQPPQAAPGYYCNQCPFLYCCEAGQDATKPRSASRAVALGMRR